MGLIGVAFLKRVIRYSRWVNGRSDELLPSPVILGLNYTLSEITLSRSRQGFISMNLTIENFLHILTKNELSL